MADQEMSLNEWCGQLSKCHRVNQELAELQAENKRLQEDHADEIGRLNDACVRIRRKLESHAIALDDLLESIYIYVQTITPESLNERFQWIKQRIDGFRAARAAESGE